MSATVASGSAGPSTTSTLAPTVGPGSAAARQLADRLTELGQRPELAGRQPQLAALAQALSDRDHAEGWQAVPLHTALGYPIVSEEEVGSPTQRLLGWLNAVRIGLVFVPVFVTWFGVSRAASRYHQELASNPELGAQSFFRLWLDGFDGRLWLTFERMAMIIAMVLVLLIGLSLLIELIRSRHEFAAAGRQHHLQEELSGALTEASVQLAQGAPDSPERFLDDLTRTAAGMSSLVSEVRSAATAAIDAMQAAETATSAAQAAAAQAHDSASALGQSVDNLVDSVGRTEAASTRLLTEFTSRSDAAATAITTAVEHSAQGLADSVTALGHSVDQVGARASEDRENIGTLLREHRHDLGQLLPTMADRIAETQTVSLDTHLSSLRDAIDELARSQQAMAAAVTNLRRRALPTVRASAAAPPAATGARAWFRRFLGGR